MKDRLRRELLNGLPGQRAHERMTSGQRRIQLKNTPDPFLPKISSVLILLYMQNGRLNTVMIQRPEYEGVHSGQIAFPGGKMEDNDTDHIVTALRETTEEIGIPAEEVEVLGKLTELYIPPSNFLVYPVVGWMDHVPAFKADPVEVAEVLTFPIDAFLDETSLQEREVKARDFTFTVPCYVINGHIIWGASAMIMTEFLEVMRTILK